MSLTCCWWERRKGQPPNQATWDIGLLVLVRESRPSHNSTFNRAVRTSLKVSEKGGGITQVGIRRLQLKGRGRLNQNSFKKSPPFKNHLSLALFLVYLFVLGEQLSRF
ncbi:hypothetical protein KP509_16G082700 [Ceratopteris richardii]|uniref:Uncharacterized protein n=1 Tax=Ceratopteris richardii TaxID=49495 RepID=A0A8T2T215_CERRI|nr:hypothetical protein KP509_16G082700 [Ceratopteris richardii]